MEIQATSSVEAAIAPVLAALERQRADARSQAGIGQQRLADYYKWAAGEAKSIAPQIQGQYNQAAQTTGAFGKGFSQGMQDALGASAAQGNAMLAQNGAPAGQQLGGGIAAAGDALYGLSGALPAQELSQQGAAFSAAAAQLPATAAGVGGQALQDLIREDNSRIATDFDDEIAKIEASRPGLIKQAMQELQGLAIAEREQRLKESAYEFETGLKLKEDARDDRAADRADAALELRWADLQFRNKKDAAAAKKAAAKGAQPNAGLSKVYGYVVDSNGQPIVDAKGKRIPVKKAGTSPGSKEVTETQKSVVIKRAQDQGNKALDNLTDRIWGRVDAYYADDAKAKKEYQKRLRQNYGTAMAQVIRAIGPHLKRIGWTQAQIRAEAARIVATQIKR
jgi:hypothetical protein